MEEEHAGTETGRRLYRSFCEAIAEQNPTPSAIMDVTTAILGALIGGFTSEEDEAVHLDIITKMTAWHSKRHRERKSREPE